MNEKRFGGIVPDWDDYLRLFANARNESALGEASVCYLWSPTAAERIFGRIPDAKVLVLLRDPSQRAFSQYLHGLAHGAIRWSFREHIRRNMRHKSTEFCIHYPFLEFGRYSEQLRPVSGAVWRNVWVGLHEDFKNRPLEVYRNICQFLGVAPRVLTQHGPPASGGPIPPPGSIGWLKNSGLWQAAARVTPRGLRLSSVARSSASREQPASIPRTGFTCRTSTAKTSANWQAFWAATWRAGCDRIRLRQTLRRGSISSRETGLM